MPVRSIGVEEEVPDPLHHGSNVVSKEDELYGHETIAQRYPPRDCYETYELSGLLPPNVSALATNIEMFGHRLEPTVDLEAEDAAEKVRDAMILERLHDELSTAVTDEELQARILEIEQVARLEQLQLKAFFASCCPEMSFVELRERKRYDEEITGNAYWEIVRDQKGWISEINHVEAVTVRLTRLGEKVPVDVQQRVSDTGLRRVKRWRRFRRFVQLLNGSEKVWFKELGDPRVMSSKTGRFYSGTTALVEAEGDGCPPATEILHWKLVTTTQPYGIPRWIGASPATGGERAAEEVNRHFFDDGGIPPGMILCSGGTVGDGSVERVKDVLRARKSKGRRAAQEIPIIEAEPHKGELGATTQTRLEYVKLVDGSQSTSHQTYIAGCAEKVGAQFRVPKILIGDMTDFNRATAESALDTVEQQVFQPPREKFDYVIDQKILTDMGVRFWRFVSNGLKVRNPDGVSMVLERLVKADIITPAEARPIAADALGRPLDPIQEDWVNKPFTELSKPRGTGDAVSDLVGMRAALEQREAGAFGAAVDAARRAEAEPEETDEEPPGVVAPAPPGAAS